MARRSRREGPLRGPSFPKELKRKGRARRNAARETGEADWGANQPPRNDLSPTLIPAEKRLDELTAPKRNVRQLDPAHVREIAHSIRALGFCSPILIDGEGRIVDGFARVEAAKLAGLSTIACIVIDHLSEAELRTLRLAMNRLQEKGAWDLNELRLEFEELIIEDAPIEIAGFSEAEIDHVLLGEEVEEGPLEPNPKLPPMARPGDVFRLGEHVVACADARHPEVWRRLMGGVGKAALILTDVPYNVKIQNNVSGGDRHREFAMASGEMTQQEFLAFNEAWMAPALSFLREGGVLSTFIDWRGLHVVTAAAMRLELAMLNLVVWAKTNAGMGSLYRSQHELLPLFKKGDAAHVNNVNLGRKGRWRSNVWRYPGASSLGSDARKGLQDHPTVKPVAMLEDALLDLTNRGDIVLDPFLGSGSTLIAAEKTRRICRGVEIDPAYVDVVIRRWERLTGGKAALINRASSAESSESADPRGPRSRESANGSVPLRLPPPVAG